MSMLLFITVIVIIVIIIIIFIPLLAVVVIPQVKTQLAGVMLDWFGRDLKVVAESYRIVSVDCQ